jgi:uncharacterized protein YjbJ (UPF0337 family)
METAKKLGNAAKHAKGKLKEEVGKNLKDDDLIVAGRAEATSADIRQAGEKVKDTARKATRK